MQPDVAEGEVDVRLADEPQIEAAEEAPQEVIEPTQEAEGRAPSQVEKVVGLKGFVIIHVFIASSSPAQGERNQMVNAKFTRPVNAMPMSNTVYRYTYIYLFQCYINRRQNCRFSFPEVQWYRARFFPDCECH